MDPQSDILTLLASFGEVDVHTLEVFMAQMKPRTLARGEILLMPGQVCSHLMYVEEGMLRHYYVTSDNREVTRWIGMAGTFNTAFASFIQQTPSNEYLQSITPARVRCLHYDDWMVLYKQYENVRSLYKYIMDHEFIALEDRVFDLIAATAEERYQRMMQKQPAMMRQAPLHYISSMLGISPQHLSRIRRKFRDED